MAVRWVTHNGKKIMVSDFSGLRKNEQMLPALEETIKEYCAQTEKVRHLLNFTDSVITSEFMNRAKEATKILPMQLTEKDAYVGISGVKSVLLKAYLMFTGEKAGVFNNEAEALDYLAK